MDGKGNRRGCMDEGPRGHVSCIQHALYWRFSMRRAVRVVVAGGVAALFAAGCGSAPSSAPVTPAGPTAAPETKVTCEAVGEAYTKNIGPFAEALTTMVQAKATAAGR